MYGIFTYIYHKNQPNAGKYTSPMDPMGSNLDHFCPQASLTRAPQIYGETVLRRLLQ